MRNKPLPGMMKHSPITAKIKTYSTKGEDPNKNKGSVKKAIKRLTFKNAFAKGAKNALKIK